MEKKLISLIMAGGKGARFWPLSRENCPKQFLNIGGGDSLLARTYRRALLVSKNIPPYIAAADDQLPLVLCHCGAEIEREQVITEPLPRNTAAAIYWSCLKISQDHDDGIVAVFPADHQIGDDNLFIETIQRAAAAAEHSGGIVVIGIRPKYIATGYGYVERGRKVEIDGCSYYKVRRFVEKPHREKARRYLKKGTYNWNSGIFVFTLKNIFHFYQEHLPEMVAAFTPMKDAIGTESEKDVLYRIFSELPSVSFDVGILEKSKNTAMVETHFPWDDVGSYNSLGALLDDDENGNIKSGNIITKDMKNSVIIADNRLVAVMGLRDVVIVEDHGVLLVCPRKRVEEIKEIVASLEGDNLNYL
ncbi:MAG TPA: hypothetical protein H9669_04765 [Firmicutes bacterium]|nr:hypothetical protein [Bacillota bacterium]